MGSLLWSVKAFQACFSLVPIEISTVVSPFHVSLFAALGFSRVNNLVNGTLVTEWTWTPFHDTKKEFINNSIGYRRQLYNLKQNFPVLNNIRENFHVYLSKVDLENDLDEVLHENLVEYLNKENPVTYLQSAKNNHMVELVEKVTGEDCRKVYDDYNFACLKDLVEWD